MNRRQFMVELRRYLSFMTPEQRDAVINRYEIIFDAAGPEGEREVIDELGSPIKLAIALSREQFKPASGSPPDDSNEDPFKEAVATENEALSEQELPEEPGYEDADETAENTEQSEQPETLPPTEEESAAETAPGGESIPDEPGVTKLEPTIDSASEPESHIDIASEQEPAFDTPLEAPVSDTPVEKEYGENIQVVSDGEPDSGIDEKAVSADMPEPDSVGAIETSTTEILTPELIKYGHPPEEEKKPRTFLSVLYTVVASIIGAVVSLAAIVVCLSLFAVPAALLGIGIYLLIAGISSFGFISDALMILGASGLSLGLGLLAAWFVIWLCIVTVRAVITGFSALQSKLFKRGGGIK